MRVGCMMHQDASLLRVGLWLREIEPSTHKGDFINPIITMIAFLLTMIKSHCSQNA